MSKILTFRLIKNISKLNTSKLPYINLNIIKQFSSSKKSRDTGKPILSDIELHVNYYSIGAKVDAIQMLFADENKRKLLDSIISMNYGNAASNGFFPSLMLYLDLQHPLLTKYGYDVFDFLVGSKEAFKKVHMAIASKDFFNYSNNFSTKSDAGDLLQDTLHPKLYKACIEASKDLNSRGIQVCDI